MGLTIFAAIPGAILRGPYLWGISPTHVDLRARNKGFSLAHPLETDQLGRDILARMMAGGKVSIAVGLTAMSLSIYLGTTIGVLAGYFKRLEGPVMRLTDLFLALPLLPLLLLILTLFREPLSQGFGPEEGIFRLIVTAIGADRPWPRLPTRFPHLGAASVRCGRSDPALSVAGDPAGIAISLAVLSVNYTGDGLRDAFDPRIRGR